MREIKSAIVTGPTGVIGAALCHLLVNKGILVYAIVRQKCKKLSYLPNSNLLKIIECDISNLSLLNEKINHADAFFHMAWKNTESISRDNMKVQAENIGYAIDAAELASFLGCQVFIGAGSQAEYGLHDIPLTPNTPCFPLTGYGAAKHCAGIMVRRRCKQLNIDCIWMRILSVYGIYQGSGSMISDLIDTLLNKKIPALTNGEQIWDYLYCEDAANAFLEVAKHGKNDSIYVLGSGQPRTLRNYIEITRDSIDPSLTLGFGEIPYTSGQVMHLEADITALTKDTGFVPLIPFEEGIRRTIKSREK